MIEKHIIEQAKSCDIVALIRSKDIVLKKNGKGYFGLCPFHADKNPSLSVNPLKNLWQCFGCGAAGDTIRFVELYDQIKFDEAVYQLTTWCGNESAKGKAACPASGKPPCLPKPVASIKLQSCLDRVVDIYEKNFIDNDKAKNYLIDRAITDTGLFTKHRVGFCDGSLNHVLPKNDADIGQALKQLGILLENGSERFVNCVVFPIHDADGKVITLYGRNIDPNSKRKHHFLPNRTTGIWNSGIIKSCSTVILTESVIDAMSVTVAGLANTVSIQGINGLGDNQIMELKAGGVNDIILLMDGDDAGEKAAKRLKEKLTAFNIETKLLPGNHDPNSYLQACGPEELARLIRQKTEEQTTAKFCVQLDDGGQGFVICCDIRKYRIMSLDKTPNKLKVTLRLEHGGKLYVDTLDLYSARARKHLAVDICRIFEQLAEAIESDIAYITKKCENMGDELKAAAQKKPKAVNITPGQKKEAERFGKSKNLIDLILKDFQTCGLIGEDANKLLGYIAMTSRKRKKPVCMLILSSSGAGKTALQDAIVDFCPPEDLVKLTSLSGKALFYKDRMSLKHKVLALEEGDGAQEAAYAIRSLISSGVLINETTIKDLSTGRLTTMENRVEGPTAVFFTTTNPDVDPETKSRFFVTGIDESREQTRKILAFQRNNHSQDDICQSIQSQAVIQKHINFQRLLKPLGVKNPYADSLTYGDDRLQSRRDQPKYLNLIKSVAFLRQMQKKIKSGTKNGKTVPWIEVDAQDIRIANMLSEEILGRSLDELSRPGRDLLMLLDEMVEAIRQKTAAADTRQKRTGISFTRRDIRQYTGWSNTRVHRYLKELVDLEYVLIEAGRNGSRHRYRLAYEGQGKDGSKFILGLTCVDELETGR